MSISIAWALAALCVALGGALAFVGRRLAAQEAFYLEVLQVLARAVDATDTAQGGTSHRARMLARALAKEMRLSSSVSRHVECAAMLHRLGRIGIDPHLLNKPGKLTAKEYEDIQKYTAIGHDILAQSKFLGPVARMILYQQEWYNGRGYPEGLKGEAIPLGSRIVGLINAWEAMRSDRPYRKALSVEQALEELRKGAGTQFDPVVVEAFLKIAQTMPR